MLTKFGSAFDKAVVSIWGGTRHATWKVAYIPAARSLTVLALGRATAFRSAGHEVLDWGRVDELGQLYDFPVSEFEEVKALCRPYVVVILNG